MTFTEAMKSETEFQTTFGKSLKEFTDSMMCVIMKGFYFDLIKFDDYLHRLHGSYEDEGKSMKDLIREKYGDGAVRLIEKLIEN